MTTGSQDAAQPDRQRVVSAGWKILAALAFAPLVALFCWRYVGLEDPVYAFDYGAYWNVFKRYGGLISTSPAWFRTAAAEIWNNDYNPSAVIPLFPFYFLGGGSRTTYISAIALLYLLPTAAIAASVATWSLRWRGMAVWAAAFVLALTYIPFWAPTLRGMVDIGGLVFLGLATLLVFRSDFLRQRPAVHAVALGVVIWAPFLFRRWYAISIVSFFVVTWVIGVFVRWRDGDRTWQSYARFTAWLALSGVILVGLIASTQGALALRILQTSYGELYAAYQVSMEQQFARIFYRNGWYVIALGAVGVLYALYRRDVHVVFCVAIGAMTFLLFSRTQVIADHHFLPIAFMLFPAYVVGAYAISSALVFMPIGLRLVPACLIGAAIFLYATTPGIQRSPTISWFVPANLLRPMKLENYPEYKRLAADLQSRVGKGTVAIYASSLILADEVMRAVDPQIAPKIVQTPHLASRDLFNFAMIQADFALVPDPPQTHMAPGTQANITIPGGMILARQGFGTAYEQIGEAYSLAGGVKAYLFERKRPVTPGEVSDLVAKLVEAYPGWTTVFARSVAPILAAVSPEPGDTYGAVRSLPNGTVFVHPGATTPTRATIPFAIEKATQRLAAITLSMSKDLLDRCPDADGVAFVLDVAGVPFKSGTVKPGEKVTEPVPAEGAAFTLTVDKGLTPSCDHVTVSFAF